VRPGRGARLRVTWSHARCVRATPRQHVRSAALTSREPRTDSSAGIRNGRSGCQFPDRDHYSQSAANPSTHEARNCCSTAGSGRRPSTRPARTGTPLFRPRSCSLFEGGDASLALHCSLDLARHEGTRSVSCCVLTLQRDKRSSKRRRPDGCLESRSCGKRGERTKH